MTKNKELKAEIERLNQEIKVLSEVDDCQCKKIQELKSIINNIIIATGYTEDPKMINFVDTILEVYKYEI